MSSWWVQWFGRDRRRGGAPGDPAGHASANALIEEGHALEAQGEWTLALASYDAALRADPALARAHLNRGNALAALGDDSGAIAAYDAVLALDGAHIGAHFNLGNLHLKMGRPQMSLPFFDRAKQLDASFVDAHVSAGFALDELRQFDAAVESYRLALRLRPDYAEVHGNLGNALRNAGRFEAAARSYRQSLALAPTRAEAHIGLGHVLKDLGDLAAAEASYREGLRRSPDNLEAHSALLFLANYRSLGSPEALLADACRFGRIASRGARPFTTWLGDDDPDRMLRVGVVSGDLRAHPVGYFFESVIHALSRRAPGRLHVTAFVTYPCADEVAERIASAVHQWVPVAGMADAFLAQRIHADAIDVLVDLAGHTAHNRLPIFAWKPAPVAVSWLGYFATTGLAEIGHLLADPWSLPVCEEAWFTESICRLPETRLCFTAPDDAIEPNALPALEKGFITLGCFNNLTKVTADVIALWSRVMQALPQSRLLLKSPQLAEESERRRIAAAFEQHGVAHGGLYMEGHSPRAEYLRRYHEVDFALDPFPFPGGTTTAESLWMGVPVLTLRGERFLSRQGSAMLTQAGLADWIADDADAYVQLAVQKASDPQGLAGLRSRLRGRVVASPLFDADRFAGHLDAALRSLWRERCAEAVSRPKPSSSG